MSGAGDISDKDAGIMLFGMKIPLQECQIPASSRMECQVQPKSATVNACSILQKIEDETHSAQNSEQTKNTYELRDSNQESQNKEEENEPKVNPKAVEDIRETSSTDQDKSFKKPDTILHCPRCNSLDTKFCYFNNYNVNQPRHFCKNCQRYWTAGGTMRNVPVGAGRRKNKQLSSQCRHIIVTSDGIPSNRLETKDSCGQHQLVSALDSAAFSSSTDNGTVLKFGPDVPLCESLESMLNLRGQNRSVDASSINCAENMEEEASLCVSIVTNAFTAGNELQERNASRPLQCYTVPPWVFSCNPGWNNVGSMVQVHQSSVRMCNPYSTDPAAMQWCHTPMVAVPTNCPPSTPLQFVPRPYLSGAPVWAAGTGTVSAGSSSWLSPSSSTSNSCCSGNGSPTLGKHNRDTAFADEEKSEMCILVPKTLRIDDPNEALKSPIWATLGIKPGKHLSESENASLKKVEHKEGRDRALGVSQILEANPAAISRAHAFQESI